MALIAALGMYDRTETAGANDRLWALMRDALRRAGHQAPQALTRGSGALMESWLSPDLMFAQTCSLPFRAKLADYVRLVTTPDYGLPGCPPGYYTSVYVARKDNGAATLAEYAGRGFAYNEALSHSGWAAPYADHLARGLALHPALWTGGHRASAQAVALGRADYAAIDALSWQLFQTYDSFAEKLVEIGRTPPSPALPYVTAASRDPAPLRAALDAAIGALGPADRAVLCLKGTADIPASAYLSLAIPPTPKIA